MSVPIVSPFELTSPIEFHCCERELLDRANGPEKIFRLPQKHHTVDQIFAKLRKADVELGKGKKVPEIFKLLKITNKT